MCQEPSKYVFCWILSGYFHNGVCKNSSYTVQILEKLDGNIAMDQEESRRENNGWGHVHKVNTSFFPDAISDSPFI